MELKGTIAKQAEKTTFVSKADAFSGAPSPRSQLEAHTGDVPEPTVYDLVGKEVKTPETKVVPNQQEEYAPSGGKADAFSGPPSPRSQLEAHTGDVPEPTVYDLVGKEVKTPETEVIPNQQEEYAPSGGKADAFSGPPSPRSQLEAHTGDVPEPHAYDLGGKEGETAETSGLAGRSSPQQKNATSPTISQGIDGR